MKFLDFNLKRKWQGAFLLLSLMLFGAGGAFAQCSGDVTLGTQAEVDAFNCTSFTGKLTISGNDINNLNGLSELSYIDGELVITNTSLASLNGLENLTYITMTGFAGTLEITNNNMLLSLSGLQNLTSIQGEVLGGFLEITNNDVLSDCCDIEDLLNGGGLSSITISNNETGCDSESEIETACSDPCAQNITLTTQAEMDAFTNCTVLDGNLTIGFPYYIPGITNLDALSGLEEVTGSLTIWNVDITGLSGLANLTSVGGQLKIINNPSLSDCCGIHDLMENGGVVGSITISGNATGCESQPTIEAACASPCTCDLTLSTQVEVDGYDCTIHDGNLTIDGSGITNLNGLVNLEQITGDILIDDSGLTSLDGLQNLTHIGGNLTLQLNSNLMSLSGLENLASIGGDLFIFSNLNLAECCPIQDLLASGNIGGSITFLANSTSCGNQSTIPSICDPCAGSKTLTTQAEVDAYDCEVHDGDLTINGSGNGGDPITNLDALSGLFRVTGNLVITSTDLTSLDGLGDLTFVDGRLDIYNNPLLQSINGINSLFEIGDDLLIEDNDALTQINGFGDLKFVRAEVLIGTNPALAALDGFPELSRVEDKFTISGNDLLASINGFNQLGSVGKDIEISDNASLVQLDGFQALIGINDGDLNILDNPSNFVSFNAFPNLFQIGPIVNCDHDLFIENNGNLTGLSNFQSLGVVRSIYITDNGEIGGTLDFPTLFLCGEIEIRRNESIAAVGNFASLSSLSSTTSGLGNLTLNGEILSDISGFTALQTIAGDLTIGGGTGVSGFPVLTTVGGLAIEESNLSSITGFASLSTVNTSIDIYANESLQTINSFNALTSFGELSISENNVLTSVQGFQAIVDAGEIYIGGNDQLTDINGFGMLETVGLNFGIIENSALANINGFQALINVSDNFRLYDNENLSSCCIFYNLLENGDVGKSTDIYNNATGCNSGPEILNSIMAVCHPSIDVYLDANGEAALTPADLDNSSTSDCGIDNLSINIELMTCDDGVATLNSTPPTVTLTVTDVNGAFATCETTVNVLDNVGPEMNCPAAHQLSLDGTGNATLSFFDIIDPNNLTDNCAVPGSHTFDLSQSAFDCTDAGTVVPVTLAVTDGFSGMGDECVVDVSVEDSTKPEMSCNFQTILELDENGEAAIDPSLALMSLSDNCTDSANIVVSFSQLTFTCDDLGQQLLTTVYAVDAHGNGAIPCHVFISLQEHVAPVINGGNTSLETTVYVDENGNAVLDDSYVLPVVTDNCSSATGLTVDFNGAPTVAFDCSQVGDLIDVPFTVADVAGNIAEGEIEVSVGENIPPVAICQDVTVYLDENGEGYIDFDEVDNGSFDNCSLKDASLSFNGTTYSFPYGEAFSAYVNCFALGTKPVYISVADGNFLEDNCMAEVTVADEIAPEANGGSPYTFAADVYLDENGNAEITAADIAAVFTDNCTAAGDLEITFYGAPNYAFDCSQLVGGPHSVEFRVWDESGNDLKEFVEVTVHDIIPHVVECQDITVDLSAQGTATISHTDVLANVTDNCDVNDLIYELDVTELVCFNVGENTVTLTATDVSGVTADCQATVTVNPLVTIDDIIVMDESCQGTSNGSLNILASGPGQMMYSIDGGSTWNLVGLFQNLDPNGYDVKVRLQGAPGCENSGFAQIESGSGGTVWYKDIDGDGFTDGPTLTSCTQPTGYVGDALPGDCNDYDAMQQPGQTWYEDLDGDGYGSGNWLTACQRPPGYFASSELIETESDCNDGIGSCYPGAPETCNGLDDDCDGEIDEGMSGGLNFVGNVTFLNQQEVDDFSSCYTAIQGNLYIKNSGVYDLSNLAGLTEVTGYVYIKSTSLSSLTGLDNLATIGGYLKVQQNSQLATLDGLQNVASVGGYLKVYYNRDLTDCCAIHGLMANGGVGGNTTISRNDTGCDDEDEIEMACAGGSNLAVPSTGNGTAVGEISVAENQLVDVFPNPATGTFTLRFAKDFEEATVRVLNLQGKVISTTGVGAGIDLQRMDVSAWPTGVYLLQITVDGEQFSERLMVK